MLTKEKVRDEKSLEIKPGITGEGTNQAISDCIHDGKKTKTLEEMGIEEIDDASLSFQLCGSNSVKIDFTEMEMILFRFLSENTEKSHSKKELQELFQEHHLTPGKTGIKNIDEIISGINKKLTAAELEKACGIKKFGKQYVSHGIETYIRKNGKSIDLNKLKQTVSWEEKRVLIEDQELFWLVYQCMRSNENIGGVKLTKKQQDQVVSLGLPLRRSDEKSDYFLV